jgi:hypothetical protein
MGGAPSLAAAATATAAFNKLALTRMIAQCGCHGTCPRLQHAFSLPPAIVKEDEKRMLQFLLIPPQRPNETDVYNHSFTTRKTNLSLIPETLC